MSHLTWGCRQITGDSDFAFDSASRLISASSSYAGGFTSSYAYTKGGRLTSLTYSRSAWGNNVSSAYAWRDTGELSTLTLPNGDTLKYLCEDRGRLSSVSYATDPGSSTCCNSSSFAYDAAGRVASVTHSFADGGLKTVYEYDPLGNIARTVEGETENLYAYDELSRLSSWTQKTDGQTTHEETYCYDGNGNITEVTSDGVPETHTYDAANQMCGVEMAYNMRCRSRKEAEKGMDFDIDRLVREEIKDLPMYNPGKSPEEVARELGIPGCVKMASNENPLGPSPRAMEAMREAIPTAHIYPDGNSIELRQALSRKLGVPADHIVVSHGADEAFDLLAFAFIDRGDEVVVGDPTFTSYELAARTMGGVARRVPLRDYRQDIPAMLEAVGERTKYVALCSPINPTGTAVSRPELEQMLQSLPRNVLLVLDEAYVEYVSDPDHPDALSYHEEYPNLVIARTFSKIYGLAGLRVGYVIASRPVRDALEKVKLPFNVNRLGQAAALAALDDEEHVARSREVNERGKRRLYRLLEETGFSYVPTQANFILVENGPYPDLFHRLLRNSVIAREGEAVGIPGHVRITIGDDAQNDVLERALRAIVGGG